MPASSRENPIAICVVELIAREGRFFTVKGLDAVDGSPLLDIKPYFPDIDFIENVKKGWTEGKLKLDKKKGKTD